MNAGANLPAVDAYLAEAIADEMSIANLLGYTTTPPDVLTPNVTIWGCKSLRFAGSHGARTVAAAKEWLPKWRRSWDGAGELIARCNLCIMVCDMRVVVGAGAGTAFTAQAEVSDHPTKDDAIRYAMCKAAIAYLTESVK